MSANWTIENLEHNSTDGGVVVAHWRVSDEEIVGENTYRATAYGTQSFSPNPADPNFIPYDQLTEAQVLQWVFDAMGVDRVVGLQEMLHQDIQDQKAPKVVSGTPWA